MSPPARVLHVVGSLDRGGVETWLMHALRAIDRGRVAFDFLTESEAAGAFEPEAVGLGARVIRCRRPRGPFRDARAIAAALRGHGPFAAVHAHAYHRAGAALVAARRVGVPIRLAHAHNDTVRQRERAPLRVRLQLAAGERAIRRAATGGLACSARAAASLYGARWREDGRWRVLPYQLDLAPFVDEVPPAAEVRAGLDLPADALVAVHVGRFVPQKNHAFLVRVAAACAAREPRFHLLLVGDGPLREEVAAAIEASALAGRARLLGVRDDVPALLRRAADVMLFPSLWEGLGIAAVEAQSAGLPVVMAEGLPEEARVVPELVRALRLDAPIARWADAVLEAAHAPRPIAAGAALARVRASALSIDRGFDELLACYGL